MKDFHCVVLGAGPGGLVAAGGLAILGARVALVERRKMGGDCLNVGCVPSKALLRAARLAAEMKEADRLGLPVSKAVPDLGRVLERVRAVRAAITPHDSPERFEALGVRVFVGERGVFMSNREVKVGDRVLRADCFVIATGGSPRIPDIPGLEEVRFHTNETLFDELDPGTRSMIVLGAGPIGCEMGQALARLGVRVTIVQRPDQILEREDPDAAEVVLDSLRRDGVEVLLGHRPTRVAKRPSGGIRLEVEAGPASGTGSPDRTRWIEADGILLSAGRKPNIGGLGLGAAGVSYDASGIRADEFLRTSRRNIYAVGDVLGGPQFTHWADAQARSVVRNVTFPWWPAPFDGEVLPHATFTEPEVAGVGLTETKARREGIGYDLFRHEMADLDRAVCDGETSGFVKILAATGSDRILGATAVGHGAGDWIHEIALAMRCGIGLGAISSTIHAYPTWGEAVRKAADAHARTRLTPFLRRVLGLRWGLRWRWVS